MMEVHANNVTLDLTILRSNANHNVIVLPIIIQLHHPAKIVTVSAKHV